MGSRCLSAAIVLSLSPLLVAPSARAAGPDVVLGDIFGTFSTPTTVENYGKVDDITAYSFGAVACNVGDQAISWVSSTPAHPVESRHLYRLKDGRFEQIGASWVKHGFYALARDDCLLGCPPGSLSGTVLDVSCSHPSNSLLSGNQYILGPRGHVNAYSGYFPYHFSSVQYPPQDLRLTIGRRIQVHDADMDPALNAGAQYFAEAQIIAADDAAAGNALNNVSYRGVDVTESFPGVFDLTLTGNTIAEQPAINAWQVNDPSVTLTTVQIPGEGQFILAYKTSAVSSFIWRYEYALYNQNSDRSAGSFSVPLANAPFILNTGFHAPSSHSGDGLPTVLGAFANQFWILKESADTLSWATDDYATDPQANALRWGTLHNFWFESDRPPVTGQVEIGLFKPGSPTSVFVTAPIPDPAADPDAIPASSDWAIAVLLAACLGAGVIAIRRQSVAALATTRS